MGEPAMSSSPPPSHLLALQRTTDLPAALNSSRDKRPESKQGRKVFGPGHAGSGSGQVMPCPPPGQRRCARRREGHAQGPAPLPGRAGLGGRLPQGWG